MKRRACIAFAGVFVGSAALAAAGSSEAAPRGHCRNRSGVAVLVSPRQPTPGQSLRVLVVSERPIANAVLSGRGPDGPLELATLDRGGPPYWWLTELPRPRAGSYRFALADGSGKPAGCVRARVRPATSRRDRVEPSADSWWETTRSWNLARENLYSAWIEKLFDAAVDQRPTWSALHEVLRDPQRNLLHNHLGTAEDGPDRKRAVVVEPDCADLPYFLRAYFAWKLRLPFGYRQCSRGSARRPPRCGELKTNLDQPVAHSAPFERLNHYLRRRVSYVHSGAGGTAGDDDETDLYPLALKREAIRPGAVYVDPAGHLMVVARWFPQQGDRSGELFVVEAQPDLTVGRKRFWRGAMLFNPRPKGPAGGFKAFRPLVLREQRIVALSNKEIRESRDHGHYSTQQYRLDKDDFYERVDRLINPQPLSPKAAYEAQLTAFFELIQKRKDSVATGEAYMRKHRFKTVQMPRGARIFQTTGAWEDYSTPSRDFRLLIAIDEVRGFPQRVVRHPDRFALGAGSKPAEVARELETLRQRVAMEKRISYTRSDGSSWTLTMADVIERRKALEMAYNPNDCVEVRWGASGEELSTCTRRAPDEQRQRMQAHREWFAARTRPQR